MKTKKFVKKLQFKKESIAELNVEETRRLNGGVDIIRTNSGCSGITCDFCDTRLSCLPEPEYCRWCWSEWPGCAD